MIFSDFFVPDTPIRCTECDKDIDKWESSEGPCLSLTFYQHQAKPDCPEPGKEYLSSEDQAVVAEGLPDRFTIVSQCPNCSSANHIVCFSKNGVWDSVRFDNQRPHNTETKLNSLHQHKLAAVDKA